MNKSIFLLYFITPFASFTAGSKALCYSKEMNGACKISDQLSIGFPFFICLSIYQSKSTESDVFCQKLKPAICCIDETTIKIPQNIFQVQKKICEYSRNLDDKPRKFQEICLQVDILQNNLFNTRCP